MRPWVGCFAALLAGCGGGDPMAPSQTSQPAGASCRTFATQQTLTLTTASSFPGVPAIDGTSTSRCAFDRPAATMRCDSATTIGSCTSTSSYTTSYASVADYVDEGALLGRILASRSESSGGSNSIPNPGGGCVSVPLPASSLTYTYDAQRRPTSASDPINGYTTTYTGWDSNGRPTRGTYNLSVCGSLPFSYGYDDVARTVTYATERGGIGTCPLLTTISTFDAMGLLSRNSGTTTISGPFGEIVTTSMGTNVVSATAQVCK